MTTMAHDAPTGGERAAMPLLPALEVVHKRRGNAIVVTTMGAAREWPKLSTEGVGPHPLDFQYLPSAMGHAPMLALGLALARPEREVICFNGDGGMLMSLGCLVTVVAAGAHNFTLIVLDNGLYEVTGGQPTAGAAEAKVGGGSCDFAAFAQGAGFHTVRRYAKLGDWEASAAEVLALPGPRFVQLFTQPVGAAYHLPAPAPMAERIQKFQAALE
ncbi:MAG: hypothetical protein C0483_21515 [Pirellula sp.]|nr:hypothetical protein [Pirellula sp.]